MRQQKAKVRALPNSDNAILEIAADETEMEVQLTSRNEVAHLCMIHGKLTRATGDHKTKIDIVMPPTFLVTRALAFGPIANCQPIPQIPLPLAYPSISSIANPHRSFYQSHCSYQSPPLPIPTVPLPTLIPQISMMISLVQIPMHIANIIDSLPNHRQIPLPTHCKSHGPLIANLDADFNCKFLSKSH